MASKKVQTRSGLGFDDLRVDPRKRRRRKRLLKIFLIILLAFLAAGSWLYASRNPQLLNQAGQVFGDVAKTIEQERKKLFKSLGKSSAKKSSPLPAAKPDFKPVLPEGKEPNQQLGYDGTRKVASYKDKIGNVDITVSEQPLPSSFQKEPDAELQKLANNFAATNVLQSTPKAYLGNSEKGPQTVILQKNGLLIFLNAVSKISDDEWVGYINKLK